MQRSCACWPVVETSLISRVSFLPNKEAVSLIPPREDVQTLLNFDSSSSLNSLGSLLLEICPVSLILAGRLNGKALFCSGMLLSCQETFPSQRLLLVGWLGQGQGSWVRMGSEQGSQSCLLHPTTGMDSTAVSDHPLLLSIPSLFNVHLYRFHQKLSHVSPAAEGQTLGGIK